MNVAVGKLRTALGDSADNPCFIETVPRRGYRFVATLEGDPVEAPPEPAASLLVAPLRRGGSSGREGGAVRGGLLVAVVELLLGLGIWLGRRTAPPQPPDFQRLTVRHGTVYSARFAPDGHNVSMPLRGMERRSRFSLPT